MDQLTPAQTRLLDAIRSRVDAGQAPPTYREMQADLGFHSTASVRDHLRALERKGFLSFGEGRFRSVRLVRDTAQATQVPVLGHVVAGVPTPAQEEFASFVEVPSQWVRGDTFALHVVVDSMKDAGILEGDVAVLRRDLAPRKGQIVRATIDGETTLKMFEPRKDGVWLVPPNAAYRPTRLPDNLLVQGVLQLSLRLYSKSKPPRPGWHRRATPSPGPGGLKSHRAPNAVVTSAGEMKQ